MPVSPPIWRPSVASEVDTSRRFWRRGDSPQRPPWALAEAQFVERCTRCSACISACPEGIITSGDGGFAAIDFSRGGCTFCGLCVEVCAPAALLRQPEQPPWQQLAQIDGRCLAANGVMCRSCEDSCEPRALRFRPQLGGISQPQIDSASCTGCGGCVAPCPVAAIRVTVPVSR